MKLLTHLENAQPRPAILTTRQGRDDQVILDIGRAVEILKRDQKRLWWVTGWQGPWGDWTAPKDVIDIARYGKASVIALEDLENVFWQYARSADGLSGPKVPCTTRSRLSGCRPSLSLRLFSFFTTTPPPVSRSSSRTINAHEVGDPTDLMGVITVNDIQRAHMHTSDYACSPARLIEWVAVGITLLLADLVSLGSGKAVLDIPLADGDVPERTLKASIRNLPLSKRY